MKIAYFDCFSGAGGDMILGALVDAGLDFARLKAEIDRLKLSHCRLEQKAVTRKGLGGTRILVSVEQDHHRHHQRRLADITLMIEQSALAADVKQQSIAVFLRLAEAEARVHRTSVDQVHFHEVGAVDTIVDVVGAAAGFRILGLDRIICSPIHVGAGTVECAHGILPVPAPATAELVRGKPVYATGVQGELLTPTGAAILTTLATGFGPMPAMRVDRIGYGAGTADRAIPNLLRVLIGREVGSRAGYEMEQVAVIETGIDDMNPQIYQHVVEKAFDLGALDVFLCPVQMKKNRPGTLLTVICAPERIRVVCDLLMRETTSIGVRWRLDNRLKAKRVIRTVATSFGNIRVKLARSGRELINAMPEYEDCRKAALEHRVVLKSVLDAARRAAFEGSWCDDEEPG